MRTIKDYFLLFAKGLAMGAADVVPGVSGGTIAFISGIYEELLSSISNVKPSLWKTFKEKGLSTVWKELNGNFLVVLFAGIATSILSLAKVIAYLWHHQPILLWSFFFGLILASIVFIGKQIKHWNVAAFIGLVLGTLVVLALSIMPPLSPSQSLIFLFFSGVIAICAMILPGISGSFILLILGAYSTILTAISDKNIVQLASLGAGAIVGLLSFSRLLNWLLKTYNNTMLAVLTGFLVGSLWKIWPWKSDSQVYVKDQGVQDFKEITELGSLSAYLRHQSADTAERIKTFVDHNIMPETYSKINGGMESEVLFAVLVCAFGFSLIFILERIAKQKGHV